MPKPIFKPVFLNDRAQHGVSYTVPRKGAVLYVGTNYRIATLKLDEGNTQVSKGTVADITYTLGAGAPDSVFVQATSGDVSGTFMNASNYSFSVLAVDQGGEISVAETLKLNVVDRPIFSLALLDARANYGPAYADPEADTFIVGES